MAVVFQYNIGSSLLANKYYYSYNKLDGTIRTQIIYDCPVLEDVIDVILNKLDNSVQKISDNVALMSDTIEKVATCILGKNDDDVKNMHQKMFERAKHSLDGADLSEVIEKIDEILELIDNSVALPCQTTQILLSNIGTICDEIFNKHIQINIALNEFENLVNDITNTIQSVAAFLNCIEADLIKDNNDTYSALLQYTRPLSFSIVDVAKSTLQAGGSASEATLAAHAKINEINNKSSRLQTIATTLEI